MLGVSGTDNKSDFGIDKTNKQMGATMRHLSAVLTLVLMAASVTAAERENCYGICPSGSPAKNKMVTRNHYTLSNNPETKFADWVAYKITRSSLGGEDERGWAKDPELDAGDTLAKSDYDGAYVALKVDRGHQAPLASMSGLKNWEVLNYLSNITPQSSALNRGAWKALEMAEREFARSLSNPTVYVITGTLYERDMKRMPQAKRPHVVPSGYWKVIAIEDGDTFKTATFVMHQDVKSGSDYCNYVVTLGDVEERTNLKLFPSLSAAQRKALAEQPGQLVERVGCEFITETASVKKIKKKTKS